MARIIGAFGIVLAAVAAFGFEHAVAQARVPALGGVYDGAISNVSGVCASEPAHTLTIMVSDYGYRIQSFTLTAVYPVPTPSSSFTLFSGVPVAADGSFGQESGAQLSGRFAGTGVSGSFRFEEGKVLGCAGDFSAELRPGGQGEQTYSGDIPLLSGCGGGSYSITRSPDHLSIVRASVTGFHAGNRLFSGSGMFSEGTVPIDAETGAFDWVYFPGQEAGQEIAISGNLSAGDIAFAVSPSTCAVIGVSSARPGGGPDGGKGGGGLPESGSGPADEGLPVWCWLLLGAGGVAACAGAIMHTVGGRSRR